ncbi:hypothetical protein QVD17_00172 [Tagetes erecta]|uniref:Uncharacterized protein n=1 Tax=Tagetes erecta TaxID=13708 RepID=A0AAD8P757_TARER|nr:hypothetical protein QVD17_00172 [Tagetes erecta]
MAHMNKLILSHSSGVEKNTLANLQLINVSLFGHLIDENYIAPKNDGLLESVVNVPPPPTPPHVPEVVHEALLFEDVLPDEPQNIPATHEEPIVEGRVKTIESSYDSDSDSEFPHACIT